MVMSLFGFKVSREKTANPEQPRDDVFLSQFKDLQLIVEEQERTIRELTTGLQRIERKQNRWLSIFNLDKVDLAKADQGESPAQPQDTAIAVHPGPAGGNSQAGDTEYE